MSRVWLCVALLGEKCSSCGSSRTPLQQFTRGMRSRQPTGMSSHVSPYVRIPFFHERGPKLGTGKNLQERLKEMFAENPQLSERVNIGFKSTAKDQSATRLMVAEWTKKNRADRQLERAAREGTLQVDLGRVRQEWEESGAVLQDIFEAAELYGINEDLFRHGYFHPSLVLNVAYPQLSAEEETDEDISIVPVYRGNVVKPAEASIEPLVSWSSKAEDDLWCLVMTGLDTHLTQEAEEYLHWMVGNIRGSDLTSGDRLCDYLAPFPPYGTGYHRFVFVLYKQDTTIDFSKEQRSQGSVSLEERTFNTYDFYSRHQDSLTPAGLAFFQSDYDRSVRHFFHHVLNMKEPRYEYEFPLPYIRSWNSYFPNDINDGFNEFMDRHRDPKDIQKEIMQKKLRHTHPFLGNLEGYMKYPAAHEVEMEEFFPAPIGQKPLNRRQSYKIPHWRRNAIQKERKREGYYASMDHADLRRDPAWSS